VALGEAPATLGVRGTIRDLASFRSSALSRPLRGWSGREQDRMEARADDLGRQAIQISNALTQNHREHLGPMMRETHTEVVEQAPAGRCVRSSHRTT
jgi:hypothetical protein